MCPCRSGQAVIDMMKLFHGCLQWQLEEEKREKIFFKPVMPQDVVVVVVGWGLGGVEKVNTLCKSDCRL